jgi:hypothetical protein
MINKNMDLGHHKLIMMAVNFTVITSSFSDLKSIDKESDDNTIKAVTK